MTATSITPRDGRLLVNWLRLLGWRIEIEVAADEWTGRATHIDPIGKEFVVGAFAHSERDVVSQLFCRALSVQSTLKAAA
jgi:hypothetical protein